MSPPLGTPLDIYTMDMQGHAQVTPTANTTVVLMPALTPPMFYALGTMSIHNTGSAAGIEVIDGVDAIDIIQTAIPATGLAVFQIQYVTQGPVQVFSSNSATTFTLTYGIIGLTA